MAQGHLMDSRDNTALQAHLADQPGSVGVCITLAARYGEVGMLEKLLPEAIAANAAFLGSAMAGLALKRAIENGHVNVVRHLVAGGVDVNLKYKGATALHEAVKADSWEVLQYLLTVSGVDRDAFNAAGRTPVMEAANRGRAQCLSVLLEAGCSPEVRNYQFRRALHYCVLPSLPVVDPDDTLACLDLLKSAGADLNVQSVFGMTPLHLAVVTDNMDAAVWLLRSECSLDVEAVPGNLNPGNLRDLGRRLAFTPLLLAVHFSNRRVAQLLIHCGARYNHLGWTVQYCRHQTLLCEFLSNCFTAPLSLQQSCRRVVRQTLRPGIDRKVAGLTLLPDSLRRYILLVDEFEQA